MSSDEAMIERLEGLEKKATAGPWKGPMISDRWPPGWIAMCEAYEDAPDEHIPGAYFLLAGHASVIEEGEVKPNPEAPLAYANLAFVAALRNSLPRLLELARKGMEGEKDAAEIAAKMMEEHAAHVKENVHGLRQENVHGLRQVTDTEHEARAREMAGVYLTECAACIRMDRTLAGIDQWIKSADVEIAALQSAQPADEKTLVEREAAPVSRTPRTDAEVKALIARGADFTMPANVMTRLAEDFEAELSALRIKADEMERERDEALRLWANRPVDSVELERRQREEGERITKIVHGVADDIVKRAESAEKERDEARAVIAQHDLCHNLHGKVDAIAFAEGCAAEQRKLYGCAPHADLVASLSAALRDIAEYETHPEWKADYRTDIQHRARSALSTLEQARPQPEILD